MTQAAARSIICVDTATYIGHNNMKSNLSEFEKYTGKKQKDVPTPLATISTGRAIALNKKASFLMKETDKHIELYYNSKKKIIGLKFLETPSTSSYSVAGQRRRNVVIRCATFITHYKIPHDKLRYYEVEYDEDEHMIFVDLHKMVKEVSPDDR